LYEEVQEMLDSILEDVTATQQRCYAAYDT
jgi:hypothetical protein